MAKQRDARTLSVAEVSQIVKPIFDNWAVRRAWLYGSVARGTQTAHSDVDLTIELTDDAHIGFGMSVCKTS